MMPLEKSIKLQRTIKLVTFLMALFLLLLVIVKVDNLMTAFLLAFVTYFLLSPIVDYLERRGISRVLAVCVPFVVLFAVFVFLFQLLFPSLVEQASGFKSQLPQYSDTITSLLGRLEAFIVKTIGPVSTVDLKARVVPEAAAWSKTVFENLPQYLSSSLTITLLGPFLAFFMLVDGRNFVRNILSLVPNNIFELVLNLNHQIASQIGGFIRARMIESLIVGLMVWAGLLILGFPYSLVLAIAAAILNVIPYLGPILGIAPAVVISLAGGVNTVELLWLLAIYGGAQVIDTIVIVPFLVAKIVNLHPVTVVLAILVGSQVLGVLGMIISIPLFSALKLSMIAIYRHLTDFRT